MERSIASKKRFEPSVNACHDGSMKTKPTDGKAALDAFTRTMKALFRVPKSAIQEESRKPIKPKQSHKHNA
jgi:hypothetical protein